MRVPIQLCYHIQTQCVECLDSRCINNLIEEEINRRDDVLTIRLCKDGCKYSCKGCTKKNKLMKL